MPSKRPKSIGWQRGRWFGGGLLIVAVFTCLKPIAAQLAVVRNNVVMFQLDENTLVNWAFGTQNQGVDAVRRQKQVELQMRIAILTKMFELTEEQKARLALIGEGDIERCFGEYSQLVRQTSTGEISQDEWGKIHQPFSMFRQRYLWGLHGGGSLFHKALGSVLSPEQREHYLKWQAEREERTDRAAIAFAVANLESILPLTIKQRERLVELLLTKGDRNERRVGGEYTMYVVLGQMSLFKDQDLLEVFTAAELKACKPQLLQFRQFREMVRQIPGGSNEEEDQN